jgi:DNA replication licensing factor MCM2
MSLEHLGDIKAASIAEWVAFEQVKRSVQKHFRSFLMTYLDANGESVYGQRIKHLGEGRYSLYSIGETTTHP